MPTQTTAHTIEEKIIDIAEDIEREHSGCRSVPAEATTKLVEFELGGRRFRYHVHLIPVLRPPDEPTVAYGWITERKREIVHRMKDRLNFSPEEAIRRWAESLV